MGIAAVGAILPLGVGPDAAHLLAMPSRALLATLIGVTGFLLYVGAAVTLADHVLPLHWTLQVLYFVIAGMAWTVPARWLMVWAVAPH